MRERRWKELSVRTCGPHVHLGEENFKNFKSKIFWFKMLHFVFKLKISIESRNMDFFNADGLIEYILQFGQNDLLKIKVRFDTSCCQVFETWWYLFLKGVVWDVLCLFKMPVKRITKNSKTIVLVLKGCLVGFLPKVSCGMFYAFLKCPLKE